MGSCIQLQQRDCFRFSRNSSHPHASLLNLAKNWNEFGEKPEEMSRREEGGVAMQWGVSGTLLFGMPENAQLGSSRVRV